MNLKSLKYELTTTTPPIWWQIKGGIDWDVWRLIRDNVLLETKFRIEVSGVLNRESWI